MSASGARRMERLVARTPASVAFRRWSRPALAVLTYHRVEDSDTFARQLDHLVSHYRPLSLDDLASRVARNASVPAGSFLITFDDGHKSVLDVALPLLRERELPAAAFVVTGMLDSDEPYWWDEVDELVAAGGRAEAVHGMAAERVVGYLKQAPDSTRLSVLEALRATAPPPAGRGDHLAEADLRELNANGVDIGSHSSTHPVLPECPIDKVRAEVEGSCARLTAILGRPPRAFAYPIGAHDDRVSAAVRDAGYELAFLFDHRRSPTVVDDPMRVSRLRVSDTTPLDRFDAIVSGLHPWVHHRVLRRS